MFRKVIIYDQRQYSYFMIFTRICFTGKELSLSLFLVKSVEPLTYHGRNVLSKDYG